MRERVPEWLEQVIGGLRDGKDWLVGMWHSLPTLLRVGGWLLFQAILFKVQSQLWYGLLTVVEVVMAMMALPLQAQLLLVVLALLATQTALAENRFKRLRKIVESMDNNSTEVSATAADGGTEIELEDGTHDWNSTPVYVACGAIAGGALGVGWGPAGVIGLAVLGAIIGDEYAQRSP